MSGGKVGNVRGRKIRVGGKKELWKMRGVEVEEIKGERLGK